MRILVTGAGGYIGRHLVPRLRAEGHEVVSLYRSDSNREQWFEPWVMADLADQRHMSLFSDLMEFERGKSLPDTVIHLAGRVDINLLPNPNGAYLSPVPGPCDIGALYRDNVLATANVLDYCLKAGVKHLIFASTQAVYGDPTTEDDIYYELAPLEHYASSKLAAERLLNLGRASGLAVTILRLPGVYGGDRKNGAVYSMCRSALTEGRIRLDLPHPLPINVLHIEDVVEAFNRVVAYHIPLRHPIAVCADGTIMFSRPYDGDTLDITGPDLCNLPILASEIGEITGATVEVSGPEQPVMDVAFYCRSTAPCINPWIPKPRKERLAQVLEEIQRESKRA